METAVVETSARTLHWTNNKQNLMEYALRYVNVFSESLLFILESAVVATSDCTFQRVNVLTVNFLKFWEVDVYFSIGAEDFNVLLGPEGIEVGTVHSLEISFNSKD